MLKCYSFLECDEPSFTPKSHNMRVHSAVVELNRMLCDLGVHLDSWVILLLFLKTIDCLFFEVAVEKRDWDRDDVIKHKHN